jgi:hypothetical protein
MRSTRSPIQFAASHGPVEHATTYADRLSGYTELDQGGRDHKRRTRTRLHDLGLNPIPVYHPFNDGWDYFGAEQYAKFVDVGGRAGYVILAVNQYMQKMRPESDGCPTRRSNSSDTRQKPPSARRTRPAPRSRSYDKA